MPRVVPAHLRHIYVVAKKKLKDGLKLGIAWSAALAASQIDMKSPGVSIRMNELAECENNTRE